MRKLAIAVGVDGELQTELGAALPPPSAFLFDDDVAAAVLQSEAAIWLASMLDVVVAGRVIVIDYARESSDLVEVRTYAEHGRAGDPLAGIGTKDITADVDLEQLQRAIRPADSISTQAEWLGSLGVESLVEEGRRLWEEGAASGSLAALKARSRIREAEALVEADGLGGFLVAQWIV